MHYLFGPVSQTFAEECLGLPRQHQECLTFDFGSGGDVAVSAKDTWQQQLLARLPSDWRPDFLVLLLSYRTIPEALWQCPLPIIGLAGDWNLLWHYYRRQLHSCDLILTDTLGVEAMSREGIEHVQQANLFGGERSFLDFAWPEVERDIDILFVGNMNDAVQGERLPWLARLAALGERWNVVIETGVFGDDYRRLLARARIVFNRSIRGEWNNRVSEAISAGALLFQEADNREVPAHLRDRQECVLYTSANLEELLHYYLEHEEKRRAIAEAARRKARCFSFATLWQEQVDRIEGDLPLLQARAAARCKVPNRLLTRSWQAINSMTGDATLSEALTAALRLDPRNAALANALGVVTSPTAARDGALVASAEAFQQAWLSDPGNLVAGLNLAECLVALGRKPEAIQQAQRTLAVLQRVQTLDAQACSALHFPAAFDEFRVRWEQAAWSHADDARESAAKLTLLRWRLHSLLAELSDDLVHHYEACTLQPDSARSQRRLGDNLAKRGRFFEAGLHLTSALERNPFDGEAARSAFQVLRETNNAAGQQRLRQQRRLLMKAAPKLVPSEPWFADAQASDAPATDRATLRIVWEGSQLSLHSLALVNRQICARLLARGHEISTLPPKMPESTVATVTGYEQLAACLYKPLTGPAEFHIAHQWPPNFEPPLAGRWIIIQPWEFGSLPAAWIKPMSEQVDEVWVPSQFVRECFIKSGIPAERVQVIPNGVDERFFAASEPLPLQTTKRFKFLFVGGTIHRKGIDVLLRTYLQTFSDRDDVCLVIKDMGVGTFYQGQTAQGLIAEFRRHPQSPEIEYLDRELDAVDMARLYAACDCLVHPYRGEAFGLPIAEAMASGLPVIVTGYGAALDFCSENNAFLIPARLQRFPEKRIDNEPTVDYPWLAEPDQDMLRYLLRHVVANPDEARHKGDKARDAIRAKFTWERVATLVNSRLAQLRTLPIRRLASRLLPSAATNSRPHHGMRISLCLIVKNEEANLEACLQSVAGLVDETIVVDTGSTDRTKDIAIGMGARVFDFPWIDSFAAARNESLRHATGEWIFWMDADDRLDDDNRKRLRDLFASLPDDNVAYVMKCLCLPDPETTTATEVDHVRLFRNHPRIRWKYRIHEQILPAIREMGGSVCWSDVMIQHVGYLDKAVRLRKRQRDLRLLSIENEDNPDDPFTLFNLGSVYQEQGDFAKALLVLRRSLELSDVSASIVRKLYAMIASCHRQLGQYRDALETCRHGRQHYPDDIELLFQEGISWRFTSRKDLAIACFEQVLKSRRADHFASVDPGLRGYKTRHYLALTYKEMGRLADAERQWLIGLNEQPTYIPSLNGLAELFLSQKRWRDVETLRANLAGIPEARIEALVLEARLFTGQKDFAAARGVLDQAIALDGLALNSRVALTHVLLQEAKDWPAAEQALREVLRLDPNNVEARQNLAVLLNQLGKPPV